MKVYQPLDHVKINPEHTFEFGRWQSMSISPTNQILNKKNKKLHINPYWPAFETFILLISYWRYAIKVFRHCYIHSIQKFQKLLETYKLSVCTMLHSFYSSRLSVLSVAFQTECVHIVTFILFISCWRHTCISLFLNNVIQDIEYFIIILVEKLC